MALFKISVPKLCTQGIAFPTIEYLLHTPIIDDQTLAYNHLNMS